MTDKPIAELTMNSTKSLAELLMGICLVFVTLANIDAASDPQIDWSEDLSATMRLAQQSSRPVLVHFYGDHCPPCRMLEKNAFKDAGLVQAINENLLAVRINAERDTKTAARFRVNRWPTDVYLYPNGDEIYRNISAQDPSAYEKTVLKVAEKNQRALSQYKSTEPVDAGSHATRAELQSSQPQNRSIHAATIRFASGEPVTRQEAAAPQEVPLLSDMPKLPSLTAGPEINSTEQNAQTSTPVVVSLSGPARVRLTEASVQSVDTAEVAVDHQAPIDLALRNTNEVSQPMITEVAEPTLQTPVAPEQLPNDQPAEQTTPTLITAPDVPDDSAAKPSLDATQAESIQDDSPNKEAEAELMNRPAPETQLPTSVAMNGYCPVSLSMAIEASQTGAAPQPAWVKGNQQYAVRHRGRVYHCASQEALTRFLAQPDLYSPVLSGCDLVEYSKSGKWIDGDCRYGFIDKETGRIFLFSSSLNCQEFAHNCESYSSMVGKSSER